jgi:hypothetical protein
MVGSAVDRRAPRECAPAPGKNAMSRLTKPAAPTVARLNDPRSTGPTPRYSVRDILALKGTKPR